MGGLGCVVCIRVSGRSDPRTDCLLIRHACLASLLLSASVWSVIPAIFKAKWRTNETLFTLMMNYVAMQLVAICRHFRRGCRSGSGSGPGRFDLTGTLPFKSEGSDYVHQHNHRRRTEQSGILFVYFRFSKHGYELSVVGESENTAKYVGINVKKGYYPHHGASPGVLCGRRRLLAGCRRDVTHTLVSQHGRGQRVHGYPGGMAR